MMKCYGFRLFWILCVSILTAVAAQAQQCHAPHNPLGPVRTCMNSFQQLDTPDNIPTGAYNDNENDHPPSVILTLGSVAGGICTTFSKQEKYIQLSWKERELAKHLSAHPMPSCSTNKLLLELVCRYRITGQDVNQAITETLKVEYDWKPGQEYKAVDQKLIYYLPETLLTNTSITLEVINLRLTCEGDNTHTNLIGNLGITDLTAILNLEVIANNYFTYAPTVSIQSPIEELRSPQGTGLKVTWNTDCNVHFEYDLEWFFVDASNHTDGNLKTYLQDDTREAVTATYYTPSDYRKAYRTYLDDPTGNSYNYCNPASYKPYQNNATRVTIVGKNHYTIPLIYEQGFVFYRIRAVGRDPQDTEKRIEGNWFGFDGDIPFHYFIEKGHEERLNWQHQMTFAEEGHQSSYADEGKRKQVISYFDGVLHNRQTVTKLNSEDFVVATESFYDHQGRASVNTLPSPVYVENVENSPYQVYYACGGVNVSLAKELSYFRGLHVTENNSIKSRFQATSFDKLPLPAEHRPFSSDCGLIAKDILGGAAHYYSVCNPEKGAYNAYIPDAFGYPFTQVEYIPDNSGRISRQGGVGPTHQIGTGKETKYAYATPSQYELDRLFGPDVGFAEHYKKNMVVDPNGQISVSYLNAGGKVIATALAGQEPEPMESLATKNTVNPTVNAIKSPGTVSDNGKKISSNETFLITSNGQCTFSYTLSNHSFIMSASELITNGCLDAPVCADCVYDLEIYILDPCGEKVTLTGILNPWLLENNVIKGQIGHDESCQSETCSNCIETETGTFTFQVEAPNFGNYTLYRTITINEKAINDRVDQVFEAFSTGNNACIKTLDDFLTEERNTLQNEYGKCCRDGSVPSVEINHCDAYEKMLLADVSPGGQYALYDQANFDANHTPIDEWKPTQSNTEENEKQSFSSKEDLKSLLNSDVWRRPLNPDILDDEGDQCEHHGFDFRCPIDQGGYDGLQFHCSDQVTDYFDENGTPSRITIEGIAYRPQDLPTVALFVKYWKPSWAKSLIIYHPEYCRLRKCREESTELLWAYEREMLKVTTFEEARTKGFLTPIPPTEEGFIQLYSSLNLTVPNNPQADPLVGFNPPNWLNNLKTFYQSGGRSLNLWQYAVITQVCTGNTPDQFIDCALEHKFPTQAQSYDYSPAEENRIWEFYRSTYLSLRQQHILGIIKSAGNCCAIEPTTLKVPRFETADKLLNHTPFAKENDEIELNRGDKDRSDIEDRVKNQINEHCSRMSKATGLTNAEKFRDCARAYGLIEQARDENNRLLFDDNNQPIMVEKPAFITDLANGFSEVSEYICKLNTDNPFGANRLPTGHRTPLSGYASFDEVIEKVLRKHGVTVNYDQDRYRMCTSDLITFPMNQKQNYFSSSGKGHSSAALDACACDKVNQAYCDFLSLKAQGHPSVSGKVFSSYFNGRYATDLSLYTLEQILCCCNGKSAYSGGAGNSFVASHDPIQLGYDLDDPNRNLVFNQVTNSSGDLLIGGIEFTHINATATPNAFSIFKSDVFGNPLWYRRYGVTDEVTGTMVEGFPLSLKSTGTHISALHYLPRKESFLLAQFDDQGVSRWSKAYNQFYTNDRIKGNGMDVDASGNYWIGGSHLSNGQKQASIIRLDTSGNSLWSKRYSIPGSDFSYFSGVAQDDQGGLMAVGGLDSMRKWQGLIMHLDTVGNILWTKKLNIPDTSLRLTVLRKDPSNRYVALGVQEQNHTDVNRISLIRFDEKGNILQFKHLGLPQVSSTVDGELNADLVLTSASEWTITGGYAEQDSAHKGFTIKTDTALTRFDAYTVATAGEDLHFASATAIGSNRTVYVGNTVQNNRSAGFLSYASGDVQPGQAPLAVLVTAAEGGIVVDYPPTQLPPIIIDPVIIVIDDVPPIHSQPEKPVTRVRKFIPTEKNCPWVPETLRCDTCISCNQVLDKIIDFQQKYIGGCETCDNLEWLKLENFPFLTEENVSREDRFLEEYYYELLQNYLNQSFSYNIRYQDYLRFLLQGRNGEVCANECLICEFCRTRGGQTQWQSVCAAYRPGGAEYEKCNANNCLPLCPKTGNDRLCNRPWFVNVERRCNCPLPPSLLACVSQPNGPQRYIDTCCVAAVELQAQVSAKIRYDRYINEIKDQLKKTYIEKCMEALTRSVIQTEENETAPVEVTSLSYPISEYHYTLYYYDQAGNLVRTVPPKAVSILSLTTPGKYESSVAYRTFMNWRKNKNNDHITFNFNLIPDHAEEGLVNNNAEILTTEYRYNSLRNMMRKRTPDDGVTRFYYDLMGKPILTQTARQIRPPFRFSFTNYDHLDRPIASGEWLIWKNAVEKDLVGLFLTDADLFNSGVFYNIEHHYSELTQLARQSSDLRVNPGAVPTEAPVYRNWVKDVVVSKTKVEGTANSHVKDLVQTFYSDAYDDALAVGLETEVSWQSPRSSDAWALQLRNRVSYVRTAERPTVRLADQSYHYQYDIHGNVKRLFSQQYQEETGQLFRKVEQDYDLIANKVNQMVFQAGALDQYIHRYVYDADNRIRIAQTSSDNFNYDEDATYQYYRHGPLARTELGTKKVQGSDNTYTLAGWIKGVNSTMLSTAKDPGKDNFEGVGGKPTFAPDVYGYSLTYYDFDNPSATQYRDYDAIGSHWQMRNPAKVYADRSPVGNWANHFEVRAETGSGVQTATKNLFNGNIARMTTAIREFMDDESGAWTPQATVYRYDQLNRLKSMEAYRNANHGNAEWFWQSGGNPTYGEIFDYDANGNIMGVARLDRGGNLLDGLTYQYRDNDNKLRNIDESIHTPLYDKDLEDQEEDNYRYDDVGNLIADKKEGIEHIEWRADGKVRRVVKKKYVGEEPVYTTLRFRYDAMGNRTEKSVYEGNQVSTTMYARDASGNVLATYKVRDMRLAEGVNIPTLNRQQAWQWLEHIYTDEQGFNGDYELFYKEVLSRIPGLRESVVGDIKTAMEGGRYDAAAVYLNDLYDYENDGFIGYGSWAFGLALEDWMRANDKGGLLEGLQARTVVREYLRTEAHLYGSSRLGMDTKEVILRKFNVNQVWNPFTESVLCLNWEIIPENIETHTYRQYRGNKRYELSNHLGNVLSVISDKLIPYEGYSPGGDSRNNTRNFLFTADVVSATDYYAFGMVMPGRTFEVAGAYRYGFNGMEKDNEWSGDDNVYFTLHRVLDVRVGRWMSPDPKTEEYPDESPYCSEENDPLNNTDPEGDCPWCVAALKGAVQEYGFQVATNLAQGKSFGDSFTDVDVKEIGKSALIDGVTLGMGGILRKGDKVIKVVNNLDKANDVQKTANKVNKVSQTTQAVSKTQKNVTKAADNTVSRKGAFAQAKRDAGIPVSQQPDKVTKVPMTSRDGSQVMQGNKPVNTREYHYTKQDGKKIVIQDHSAGHQYPGGVGNQGPHFNVRPGDNTRTGNVAGTKDHYTFKVKGTN